MVSVVLDVDCLVYLCVSVLGLLIAGMYFNSEHSIIEHYNYICMVYYNFANIVFDHDNLIFDSLVKN